MVSILKNKKISFFLVSAFLLLIVVVLFFIFLNWSKKESSVYISGKQLTVEIADNPSERYLGLSSRKNLLEDHGLLFIFSDYAKRRFVMRDMNFPLDIIFIKDGVVKEIKADCPPEGNNPLVIYESKDDINMVLEVPASYAKKNNIVIGSSFKISENLK
jgi:hypothetical protein